MYGNACKIPQSIPIWPRNAFINKWFKNCSDRLLSDPELLVFAKGLNCAITPPDLPEVDINANEKACSSLQAEEARVCQAKIANLLGGPRSVPRNLNIEERKTLKTLTEDKSIHILPADKGLFVVVLNSKDYDEKIKRLFWKTQKPM